jgi:hypothetical protein
VDAVWRCGPPWASSSPLPCLPSITSMDPSLRLYGHRRASFCPGSPPYQHGPCWDGRVGGWLGLTINGVHAQLLVTAAGSGFRSFAQA